MKKISSFVCVLLLSSLSLMAVRLEVEIGERDKNFEENRLNRFKRAKTIVKKTLATERGYYKEVNCENRSGIGVDVRLESLPEGKVQLYIDPYKMEGNEKKPLPGVWATSRVIDVGGRSSFVSREYSFEFPYGQNGKELTVVVSHKFD